MNEESNSQFTEVTIFERVYQIPISTFLLFGAIAFVFFLAFTYVTIYSPIYLVADIDKGLVYYERKSIIPVDKILFIKLNDYKESNGYIYSYLSLVLTQLKMARSLHISGWRGIDYQHIKVAKALSAFIDKEIKDLRQFNYSDTDL